MSSWARTAALRLAAASPDAVLPLAVRSGARLRRVRAESLAAGMGLESAALRAADRHTESIGALRLCLHSAELDPRRNLGRVVVAAVMERLTCRSAQRTTSHDVSATIEGTSASDLDAPRWGVLARLLASHGLLVPSLVARSRAREVAIQGRGVTASRAILDLDDVSSLDLARALESADAHGRAHAALLKLGPKHVIDGSPETRAIVRGRRVALVGSAVVEGDHGSDIDSHEVVARTKYFGPNYLQAGRHVGTATNIGFYNKAMLTHIRRAITSSDSSVIGSLRELDLVVGKRSVLLNNAVGLAEHCPTFLTPALLGTRAMFHLLIAEPAELSLFGFDFYLAPRAHSPADFAEVKRQERGGTRSNAHYCMSFGRHHPVSQIRFVRNLWKAGAVVPHGRTAEVLAMSDLEYVTRLEERYANWDE